MGKITKELFFDAINAIQLQMLKDVANADLIGRVFGSSDINPYDNSPLINTIISLLRVSFPVDAEGFCAIEHFCFQINFGKVGGQELVTLDDLWFHLTK